MNYSTDALKIIASSIFARYPIQRAWLLNPSDSDSSSYVEFLVDLQIGADITVCLDAAADIEDTIHKETVVRRIINNHMPTVERVLVYECSRAEAQALTRYTIKNKASMDETLILARNNLKVANCLVEANDADLLNSACSEISVAIELCLRYLLTGREIQDAQPYSIVILVNILADRGYPIDEWIIHHTEDLEHWKIDMLATIDPALCIEGLRKGQELLEYCKSLDTE